jgi:hypothetical protein
MCLTLSAASTPDITMVSARNCCDFRDTRRPGLTGALHRVPLDPARRRLDIAGLKQD